MTKQLIATIRGGINKKKLIFSEKLRNPETPPPPSSSLEAPVFCDKEILELARLPPPFWQKIPKYSQYFFYEIPMYCVKPPLLVKIYKRIHSFYDNTLLE